MSDHHPHEPIAGPSTPSGYQTYGPPPPPAFPAPATVRRRGRTRPGVASVLAVGALAASTVAGHELWPTATGPRATAAAGGASPAAPAPGGSNGSAASAAQGAGAPADVTAVAAKVDPAVVDIWTTLGYQGAQGAGTGIVISPRGEILTNNHVVDGATAIKVTDIGNGRTYAATVVGYDSSQDVAVLQLTGASGLATAAIGGSGGATTGEAVVAVGNAGGAGGTPSAAGGSVTAVDRSITASDQLDGTSEALSHLIETNADVQAGDSGGPLVDSAGRVIGMDTAAASGFALQSAAAGTSRGYAIPIERAVSVARAIESGQASSTVHTGPTAFLGVMLSPSGSVWAPPGATIGAVVPGGAAALAGLGAGDTITALGGRPVTSATDLSRIVAGERPGRTATIVWTDPSGAPHTATVTLRAGPPA